jgi:hypothetical protein
MRIYIYIIRNDKRMFLLTQKREQEPGVGTVEPIERIFGSVLHIESELKIFIIISKEFSCVECVAVFCSFFRLYMCSMRCTLVSNRKKSVYA